MHSALGLFANDPRNAGLAWSNAALAGRHVDDWVSLYEPYAVPFDDEDRLMASSADERVDSSSSTKRVPGNRWPDTDPHAD